MDDEILLIIKKYCKENGYRKTAKKIKAKGDVPSIQLEDVFEKLEVSGRKRKIKVTPLNSNRGFEGRSF